MADQQITQLPEETGTVGALFPFAIVNTDAAETRKISTENLATAIAANIGTGGLAASKIAAGYSGASLTDGTVTNAKLVSSSVNFGGVSVSLGSQNLTPSFNLQDATGYPASALTGTISNSQLAGSIAVSKLAFNFVNFGGISLVLGTSDATPAFDLTDATNYKTTNLVGTITNAQLAGSIENSKLSNSSVSFGGISLALGASDPHPAFDLQDSTGYKTTNLVGTITNAQLSGSIDASKLVANSLTSTQLGANCVGSSELANNAVDSGAVQTGAITNDKIETSSSSSTGIDGATKLRDGTVTANKLNASTVGNGLAINSNVLSINNAISGATSLGLTFSNQGICTGITAIQASDLSGVLATASAVGVVKVPSSGGLSVSGSGDLSFATTITAFNTRGINVNAFGQVLSVSATVPSASLPVGNTTTIGAIKVPSTSSPLTVDGNGVLTIGLSGVTAGTGFSKFNVNDQGLITSASGLDASDIPAHSAGLLTSGTIDAARIGLSTIDASKLSDSSTTIFQSIAQSGFPTAQFNGQLLFDTVDEDAYIWDGTGWQAITTLTKGSLVFGGTYNAKTAQMIRCTAAGISAGLSNGSNLPTASGTTDGIYVVVAEPTEAGTNNGLGVSPAPTVALAPPDYIIGVTTSANASEWLEVDLSATIATQTASNITFSNTGSGIDGVLSGTVQDAIEELATEKLAKAGGTISGQLLIGHTGSMVFEGSTNDGNKLTLAVQDPQSSSKTLTLPDNTGTLVSTGSSGVVTSAMITDATIVNTDISATAAIALSKLVAVSAGQILVGASGTGAITAVTPTGDIALSEAGAMSYVAGSIVNADISGSAAIAGSKVTTGTTSAVGVLQLVDSTTSTSTSLAATGASVKAAKDAADSAQSTANAALPKTGGTLTGNLILDDANELRLNEPTVEGETKHHTGLKAQAQAGDITLTLPAVSPAAGQVLKADASTPTTLTWASDGFTAGSASNLNAGTLGDARFPATLPAISGENLTSLNASNISSGTIAAARVGTLNQNTTGSSGSCTGDAAGLSGSPNITVGTIDCGNITGIGTVSDSKGELRTIVQTSKSSQHTIVASDAGKHSINSSGGWVFNASTGFTAGQAITLINNSGSDQTITATGVTLYNTADAATGNRTLAQRGMATLLCTASNTYYISGAGLS